MRRLYVLSELTLKSKVRMGVSFGERVVEMNVPLHDLFHPQIGSCYMDLIAYTSEDNARLKHDDPKAWEALPEVTAWRAAGSQILLSTSLAHSERCEEIFTSHPDVAILPHPVLFGNDKLSDKKPKAPKLQPGDDPMEEVLDPDRKIKRKHIEALKQHHTLGFDEATDSVTSLAEKASKVNGGVKLSRNATL
jgi:hypothetical protein